MAETGSVPDKNEGIAALSLLEEAVELLDRFDTPVEIAGHVQLAIDRLRSILFPDAPEPEITLDE